MGKKGGNKKTKALYAPKTVNIKRKNQVWTVHTRPGAHTRTHSVALGIVLRDLTGLVRNMKEAKSILNAKKVNVNGIVCEDVRRGVGLFDTIDIAEQKVFYRVVVDTKGRLGVKVLEKAASEKVAKVTHKTMSPRGVQITTADGRVYFTNDAKVDDSIVLALPSGKLQSVLALEKGALVFLTKGEHCAKTATVTEIVPGTVKRSKLVKLSGDAGEFETVSTNVIVIGKGKSAIKDIQ